MPVRYYSNAPATTLASGCTDSALTISVVSVAGFPIQYPYTLILDRGTASEEAVSVTNASGTTLTVTRAIDSTTAFSHANGAAVEHGITAQDVREPNTHINANSGVHGVSGSVVGTSDAQTLSNKDLTSPSNLFPPTLATDAEVASAVNTHAAVTNTHGATSSIVGKDDIQTLTNKTIALGSNTVSGTVAQLNAAISDADVATLAGAETLTDKTLTSPIITVAGLTALPPVRCTSATRPAHNEGQVIYETDTELMQVSDGVNWRVVQADVTGWTAVTFTGSWVDFGAPWQAAQYKKVGNRVKVRGMVKSGVSGTSVFTLPVGFRPPADLRFAVDGAGGYAFANVTSAGLVVVTGVTSTSVSLNFDFEV